MAGPDRNAARRRKPLGSIGFLRRGCQLRTGSSTYPSASGARSLRGRSREERHARAVDGRLLFRLIPAKPQSVAFDTKFAMLYTINNYVDRRLGGERIPSMFPSGKTLERGGRPCRACHAPPSGGTQPLSSFLGHGACRSPGEPPLPPCSSVSPGISPPPLLPSTTSSSSSWRTGPTTRS